MKKLARMALVLLGTVLINTSTLAQEVAAMASVIEIVNFRLAKGVSRADFISTNNALERDYISRRAGFVSRETAVGDDGEWLVVVRWKSVQDADASMQSFEKAPDAARFMAQIDGSTFRMKRFTKPAP